MSICNRNLCHETATRCVEMTYSSQGHQSKGVGHFCTKHSYAMRWGLKAWSVYVRPLT